MKSEIFQVTERPYSIIDKSRMNKITFTLKFKLNVLSDSMRQLRQNYFYDFYHNSNYVCKQLY